MKKLLINWKTTLAGVVAIITALGPLAEAAQRSDWNALWMMIPSVVMGVGLILAKDFDVHIA
jgi:hypothetical protein